MVKAKSANWFEDWFNTKYYHDLYRHRDEQEASDFVGALKNKFQWGAGEVVLDLCCGNGRHALGIEKMGVETWGVDLSVDNIGMAQASSMFPDRWHVQDVRDLKLPLKFNSILNLFTSFGYFESDIEHQQMLENVRDHLQPGGMFLMDFFNLNSVRNSLILSEVQNGLLTDYTISRSIDDQWVRKEIVFEAEGKTMRFEEKVRAFGPHQISRMLQKVGFEVVDHWGDYKLGPFKEGSPRSIFICKL